MTQEMMIEQHPHDGVYFVDCPKCRASGPIPFPFSYISTISGGKFTVLGWGWKMFREKRLINRDPAGREWHLTVPITRELLKALKIDQGDLPD